MYSSREKSFAQKRKETELFASMGNEPSGWVPGFAVGGRWRAELGAGQGVKIERCRVLDQSGCVAVCANVCKYPTQKFFTEGAGLPLTMVSVMWACTVLSSCSFGAEAGG